MAGRESAHLPIEVLGDPLIAAHGEDSRSHLGALIPAGAAYASHHAVLEQSNHGVLLDDDLFSGSLGGMSMGGIFPAGNSRDASVIVYAQPHGVMDSRDCHSLMGLMSPQHSRHVPVASDVVLPAAHNASRQHHVAHGFLHGAGYNAVPPQPTTDHFPISVVPLPPSTPGGHQPYKYEAGKVARASPDGEAGEKKLQGTWTAEENNNFFNALRAHGRSFDKIHDEMGGTKSREQVRCYYYRVIKKINQMIASTGAKIDKGAGAEGSGVIEAMLCWWDWMHVGSAEDTSVNLFKKSATLDEAQRAEFVQRLWERSAAKVDEPPKADSVSDTPSAQADGAAVGAAPAAAAQALRVGMAHAVTKIDFDAVAGGGSPKGAASSPTFSSVKARAVKLEPSPVVPLARQEMVSSARPGRVGMTPSREDVAGGSPRVAIGETPNRDERLSLAAQSPSQHSACSSSIANSPHDCSNQSDAALAAPLAALPPECRDPGFRFRLRLIPRDPQLSQLISACGFNPMLELTFKPTKSIGSVVVHLIDKWGPKVLQELAARAQPGTPAPARVEFRLHSTRHPNHVGWGQLDKATTTAEVFDFAGRPVNFRLQYALVFDPPGVERGAPPPASRPALATSPKTHAVPAAPPQRPAPHACAGGPGVQPVQEPAPAAHEFVPFQRHRSGGEGGAQACGAAGRADGRAGGEGGAEALPREGADAVAGAGAGAGAQIDLTCHETLGPADSRGWSRGAHARRLDYAQGGHGGWPREETELFASILESRDGQPYSHFTGDSMDGLGLLLREDGSNSNGSNGGMSARAFFALAEISQGARPADFAPRAECSAGVKRAADGGADAIAQLEREKRARPL